MRGKSTNQNSKPEIKLHIVHIFLSVGISWFCICKCLATELFLCSLYIFNLYVLQCKQPQRQNGSIANFRIPVSFGGRCSPTEVVDTDVIIVVVHREFKGRQFPRLTIYVCFVCWDKFWFRVFCIDQIVSLTVSRKFTSDG